MPRVSQEQARRNRERVVEVAASLFRERGLHGVGVADIMAAAGLTVGGFYGQFANKEALAAEAFDSALREDRRGQLHDLLANYLSIAHVRTPGMGCPVAALANDVGREAPDSPVRSRFTRGVRGLLDLTACLLPKVTREKRRERALASLATLVGAVVLARAVDDEDFATEILAAARASFDGAPPEIGTPEASSGRG